MRDAQFDQLHLAHSRHEPSRLASNLLRQSLSQRHLHAGAAPTLAFILFIPVAAAPIALVLSTLRLCGSGAAHQGELRVRCGGQVQTFQSFNRHQRHCPGVRYRQQCRSGTHTHSYTSSSVHPVITRPAVYTYTPIYKQHSRTVYKQMVVQPCAVCSIRADFY